MNVFMAQKFALSILQQICSCCEGKFDAGSDSQTSVLNAVLS